VIEATPSGHRRRPRYRGTHPRRFHEKYKELNASAHPDTVRKVIDSGKTPAGMHRPVCLTEIMELLAPKPGELAVDATLGYGGHALALWERIQPGGILIGLDVDAAELAKTEARLRPRVTPDASLRVAHSNFAGLAKILAGFELGGADLVLADLGCSSMQLDDPDRGFSWKHDGPLDLRLNPSKGLAAADWLSRLSAAELARQLRDYADEPDAERLAEFLVERQGRRPIRRTLELAAAVAEFKSGRNRRVDRVELARSQQRVFQALRIGVNDEFKALETFLRFLPDCLKPGGRVAILSFHSGEDRRVKHAFREGFTHGVYQSIAQEVIRPSAVEVRDNPRSASARLRWAIRR
jgi:16S rRNA (cytosine1402-N4)-methyltransferase